MLLADIYHTFSFSDIAASPATLGSTYIYIDPQSINHKLSLSNTHRNMSSKAGLVDWRGRPVDTKKHGGVRASMFIHSN